MLVTIHQPEFLPWLGFFDKVRQADVCVLLDHVQFRKNYFQNRNRIRTAVDQGWSWLSVPVLTSGRFGQAINEVPINNSTGWRRQHLASLWQNYHTAPFFQRLYDSLEDVYEGEFDLLVELNTRLIFLLASELGVATRFVRSSELQVRGAQSELLLSICRELRASEYLAGISGREYLARELFDEAGIQVRFQEFHHPVYPQVYEPFVPCMSAIDLLFNHGEGSMAVLAEEATPRLSELFV